ncbi:DUF4809 family protein [Carnobacterium gallinarum]|uniref:DUF4809 family protein n=1 Tax=Carnobacterium gallinarum TaxID=2749 RepID=UPI000550BBAB|nr:DUF4809 family protein [Carnobacterium gallinarum]
MEKAVITSTVDLSDGGCNACGLVEDTMYTLAINDVEIPVDDLTVNSLVMAIALRKGYKQELVMDISDEYIVYKNGVESIQLIEDVDQLTYSNDTLTIETANKILDTNILLTKVNEILTKLFKLEELDFVL